MTPEELPALLSAIDGYDELGDKQTGYALRLLALTFVRTGELIGAEWSEIDMDGATWIIPAARMKMKTEHVVPLSRQALAILRELRAIGGGSRYVFPGRNPDKPISNNTMLFALYRLGYKGKMTGHGFRAVASTILNEAGLPPDVIERQLAHSERERGARRLQPRRVPARAAQDDAAMGRHAGTRWRRARSVIPLQAAGVQTIRSTPRLARRGECWAPYPSGAAPHRAPREAQW